MDDAEVAAAAAAAAAKSKAQKKNEKRREKEKEKGAPGGTVDAMAAKLSATSIAAAPGPSKPVPAQPPAAPAPVPAAPEDPKATLEKQIRATNKKLRQCDALLTRQAAGDAMTAQELEKLGRVPGWQAEVAALEAQLAAL